MNRFQKIVLYGAAANLLLLFVFPPYDLIGLGRGAPMFDAFYPVFSVPANRVLNGDVLYLLAFGVLINAALAWLLLGSPSSTPGVPRFEAQTVAIVFGMVNLVVVLLFPPMEAFGFAQRVTVGTFDGFYFAFGDKSRRSIFVPLLYMEVLFVLTNACAYWLAMSVAGRGASAAEAGPHTMLAQSAVLRQRAEQKLDAAQGPGLSVAKRGPDRRRGPDPAYKGPDRRKRSDRRRRA
ncbi:MAG: hypothetical protein ABI630_01855 [Betaproteobacteria bacterium]